MKTVLAINGGGIRGIVPAVAVAHLEHVAARPAAKLFDLVAGTSTGGILACMIGAGLSADSTVDLYHRYGPDIFRRRLLGRLPLLRCKYGAAGMERALLDVLGNRKLSDCRTEILIPALDCASNEPYFFKSSEARFGQQTDYELRYVARATSAAMTYFPMADKRFVDGGVFANNPSLAAYAEAIRMWPTERITILNLGTGYTRECIDARRLEFAGAAQWARPLLSILIDGTQADSIYILRTLAAARGDVFVSLDAQLEQCATAMDAATPWNMMALQAFATVMISRSSDSWISAVIAASTQPAAQSVP